MCQEISSSLTTPLPTSAAEHDSHDRCLLGLNAAAPEYWALSLQRHVLPTHAHVATHGDTPQEYAPTRSLCMRQGAAESMQIEGYLTGRMSTRVATHGDTPQEYASTRLLCMRQGAAEPMQIEGHLTGRMSTTILHVGNQKDRWHSPSPA
jgi:hypothetical protein